VGDVIYVYETPKPSRAPAARPVAARVGALPDPPEAELLAQARQELLAPAQPEPVYGTPLEEAPEPVAEPARVPWRLGALGDTPDPAVVRPTRSLGRAPADATGWPVAATEVSGGARVLTRTRSTMLPPPPGYALEFGTGRIVPVRGSGGRWVRGS
jgi:hypothetical protein